MSVGFTTGSNFMTFYVQYFTTYRKASSAVSILPNNCISQSFPLKNKDQKDKATPTGIKKKNKNDCIPITRTPKVVSSNSSH